MPGEFERLTYEAALRGELLTVIALAAFVVSIGTSVFILLPKRGLVFSEAGSGFFSALHSMRTDMPEVHRRMAYELDRKCNDRIIGTLTRAYIVGSCALAVETLSLAALVSATLI